MSWSSQETLGFGQANGSHPNEDKHKAPSTSLPHPLSLQPIGPLAALSLPIRLSKIVRRCNFYQPALQKGALAFVLAEFER